MKYQAERRRLLLSTLRGTIEGTIPLLDGCRSIVRYLDSLPEELSRSDAALALVGVVSETDSYPNRKHRDLWSDELLRRLDRQLDDYLCAIREGVLDACRELETAVVAQ